MNLDDILDEFLTRCASVARLNVQFLKNRVKSGDAVVWRGAIVTVMAKNLGMTELEISQYFERSQQGVHESKRLFSQFLKCSPDAQYIFGKVQKIARDVSNEFGGPFRKSPLPRRNCLKHGGPFTPSHSGEYICPSCKKTRDWKDGPNDEFRVIR